MWEDSSITFPYIVILTRTSVRSLFDVKHMLQLKHLIAVLFLTSDIERRKKHKAQRALGGKKRNRKKSSDFLGGEGNGDAVTRNCRHSSQIAGCSGIKTTECGERGLAINPLSARDQPMTLVRSFSFI